MKKFACTISAFIALFAYGQTNYQIAVPGCFHGEDVNTKPSNNWFALVHNNSTQQCSLVKVEVLIEPCFDAMLDSEDEMSGKELKLNNKTSPDHRVIAIISGIGEVEEGLIEGEMSIDPIFPGQTKRVYLSESNNNYQLYGYGNAQPLNEKNKQPAVKEYQLMLVKNPFGEGKQSQTIIQNYLFSGDENQPNPVFIGDLNQDGELDLIFNMSNHYNRSNLTLFLSNPDNKEKLVEQVAEWNTTGC